MAGAINQSETIRGSVHVESYSTDTGQKTGQADCANNWAFYSENRPATVTSKPSASGWREPLPWSHEKTVRVEPNFVCEMTSGHTRYQISGNLSDCFINGGGGLPSLGNLEDLAVDQALLHLSDGGTGLAEDFAQRQQTADMIAGVGHHIGNSVNQYKRRLPRDWSKVKKLTYFGKKAVGAIPNSWLELQYGWVPLLLDAKGVYDVMKHRDSDGDCPRITAKGFRFTDETVTSSPNYLLTGGSCSGPICYVKYHYRDVAGAFVRLDYNMVNPMLHELQQLGVVNPAAIAWDLVPYSFVADWFLPIGQYLQAWTADLGFSFIGGSISLMQKRNTGVEFDRTYYHGGTCNLSGGRYESMAFSRTTLSSSPAPRMPHFKNPLSLRHFANAMSLLVSAFR